VAPRLPFVGVGLLPFCFGVNDLLIQQSTSTTCF
jgi:hypothetical protein